MHNLVARGLVVGLFAVVAPRHALAMHHVFSSSVDRFEADGNVYGTFDGTPDFVDDFDGTLAPEWSILLGTAVESNGVVALENPGTDFTIGGVSVDVSNIEQEDAVTDGGGNFTATTYWLGALPVPGAEFHFQIYTLSGTIVSAGMSVGSDGSITLAQLHVAGGNPANDAAYTVPTAPADLTGEIVLRLSYDDATNMLSGSFSLDGGSTFHSPFPALHIFTDVSDGEFLLGAGFFSSSPTPTTTTTSTQASTTSTTAVSATHAVPLQRFQLRGSGAPSTGRLQYVGHDDAPVAIGVVGAPDLYGATLAIRLDNQSACYDLPTSGWTRVGASGFKFRQRGLPSRAAQIKKNKNGDLLLKFVGRGFVGLVPPNPGTRADVNLHLGAGDSYCSSTLGGTLGPNDGRTFRVRNAPAATCAIPACP